MITRLHFQKLIILLAAACLFTSCVTTRQVVVRNYDYDKDISFTIEKIEETSQIGSWMGGSYVPTKGNVFVAMYVTVKNSSAQKLPLDFKNFYLLDTLTHTKHKVEFAMLPTKVSMWANRDSDIGANDTKRRRLVFTYPEKRRAEAFAVNDHVYNIEYKDPAKKASN
ncbi:DUF4352 domain-containing protein [Mucilaginibacter lutimaris]|uniref:DUF4352 domain-containing protein n=1 Tax=Mucilaginibacter lutimaris TaxID=931629 RepID=A0ABW2ZH73_9SPHI